MSPTPDARRPTLEAPIREQALKQLASETMPSSNTAHAVNASMQINRKLASGARVETVHILCYE